jgi:hypothetical protein
VLQRPGRRSHLAQSYVQDAEEQEQASFIQPNSGSPVNVALRAPETDRVPSLTRSEMSATDASEAASTPDGPSRRVNMAPIESPARTLDYSAAEEPQSDILEPPS